MKTPFTYLAVFAFLSLSCSAGDDDDDNAQIAETYDNIEIPKNEKMIQQIKLTIGNKTLTATLADNEATRVLVQKLSEKAITIQSDDYGGFEKVGALGFSLPTSDERITTHSGDIMLYCGNQIVIFYGSNTWSYTPIGQIEYSSEDELKTFLNAGKGSVKVNLEL